MSRIAPLQPPYAPEIQQQFDRVMRGAPPLVLFRVMAGNARAWEKFRAGSLLDRGPLSLREREIVIDRTCALTKCEYEWGVHVTAFAGAAHLTADEIRASFLRLALLVAGGDHQHFLGLAEAVRHHDGPADHLVGVFRINAEAHMHLYRLIELCESDLLKERDRLLDRVFALLNLPQSCLIFSAWFPCHVSSLVQAAAQRPNNTRSEAHTSH